MFFFLTFFVWLPLETMSNNNSAFWTNFFVKIFCCFSGIFKFLARQHAKKNQKMIWRFLFCTWIPKLSLNSSFFFLICTLFRFTGGGNLKEKCCGKNSGRHSVQEFPQLFKIPPAFILLEVQFPLETARFFLWRFAPILDMCFLFQSHCSRTCTHHPKWTI